ncbi:MAG: glutathione S-transferase N-terminal domain-containing protein [Myxococcales bacterium]|nr:glutaredoxin [Myxococcales bacterium]HIK83730.1 glutaredoxin [Myxococcales bacterium]
MMGEEEAHGLTIYGYPQCPFCRRVFNAAASLGLEIPLRNTLFGGEDKRDLKEAVGRTTVPVLRIEQEGANTVWISESADIVAYLEERFGTTA